MMVTSKKEIIFRKHQAYIDDEKEIAEINA